MKTLRHVLLLTVAAALSATGCTGGGDAEPPGNSATISGQVTDEQALAPMAGVSVRAYVAVEGELRAVSDFAETDANGRYELTVEFDSDVLTDVIVEATNDASFEARALISSTIEDGEEHTAPPMDNETRVEADVYVAASAHGSWSSSSGSGTTSSGVRASIDAELAASLSASTNYVSDVAACANSIVLGLRARAESFAHSTIGMTDAQIDALLEAEAEAQAELDAALDSATSQAQIDAAIEAYMSALIDVWMDAGLTLGEVSQAVNAQIHAAMSASASLSSSVQASLREHLESIRARVMTEANNAYFTVLGVSTTIESGLASAQTQLEAAIEASAGVQADIESAWASYQAYIEAELRTHLDTLQSGADTAYDSVVSSLATAETTLMSALTAAGNDVNAIVEAYGSFSASVEAAVTADATLGSMASAHVEATAYLILNVRLSEL